MQSVCRTEVQDEYSRMRRTKKYENIENKMQKKCVDDDHDGVTNDVADQMLTVATVADFRRHDDNMYARTHKRTPTHTTRSAISKLL